MYAVAILALWVTGAVALFVCALRYAPVRAAVWAVAGAMLAIWLYEYGFRHFVGFYDKPVNAIADAALLAWAADIAVVMLLAIGAMVWLRVGSTSTAARGRHSSQSKPLGRGTWTGKLS